MSRPRRPSDWHARVAAFYLKVAEVCWEHGGSVDSGIRSEARNAMVGGNPRSRHLLALAADCIHDTREGRDAAWAAGRAKGLRGYTKGLRRIHWQDRPAPPPN